MSRTYGSSFRITTASNLWAHIYRKPALSPQQEKPQLQWGEDVQNLQVWYVQNLPVWYVQKKQADSHARTLEKLENSRPQLPLKVWVEWLRVGTDEGSLSGPLASSLTHWRLREVASEKSCPQRHQEHLREEVRNPPESKGIEWQAPYWKGSRVPSSPGSVSNTGRQDFLCGGPINLKERSRQSENGACAHRTGELSPEAYQLLGPGLAWFPTVSFSSSLTRKDS